MAKMKNFNIVRMWKNRLFRLSWREYMYIDQIFNLAKPVSINSAHHLDAVILFVGIYPVDTLNLYMCTQWYSGRHTVYIQDGKRMKHSFIGDELDKIWVLYSEMLCSYWRNMAKLCNGMQLKIMSCHPCSSVYL